MQQAEAHSDAVAKQEQTLARQIESYVRLEEAKTAGDAAAAQKISELEATNTRFLTKIAQLEDYQSHFKSEPGNEGMIGGG